MPMRKARLNRSIETKSSPVFEKAFEKTPFPTAGRIRVHTVSDERMARIERRLKQNGMIRPVISLTDPAADTRTHVARIFKNGKPTREYTVPILLKGQGSPPHEYKHARAGVFGVEHGIKRNPIGMLSFIDETLFDLETVHFEYYPRFRVDLAKEDLRRAYEELMSTKTSLDATYSARGFLHTAMYVLRHQFTSRRSFMRALIEMQRDPTIRRMMQRLNSIPLVVGPSLANPLDSTPQKGIQNFIDPRRVKQFVAIWPMVEFMERKASEYRERNYTEKSAGLPRNKWKKRLNG